MKCGLWDYIMSQGGLSEAYKKSIAEKEIPYDTYTGDSLALFRVQGSGPENMQSIQVEPVDRGINPEVVRSVDCTVRFLEDFEIDYKYIETLEEAVEDQVSEIVLSENSELICEQLWSWKDDLEAAVYDVALRGKILARNTRYEALKAVKAYLEEAWHDLGPSYLETVAEDVMVAL